MPLIQVTMMEGRTPEQKAAFMRELAAAAMNALGSSPESVRVALYEVSPDHFSVGGESMTSRRAMSAASS